MNRHAAMLQLAVPKVARFPSVPAHTLELAMRYMGGLLGHRVPGAGNVALACCPDLCMVPHLWQPPLQVPALMPMHINACCVLVIKQFMAEAQVQPCKLRWTQLAVAAPASLTGPAQPTRRHAHNIRHVATVSRIPGARQGAGGGMCLPVRRSEAQESRR